MNMNTETRHYLAYHNTERMGRPLKEADPFHVLTNKRVGNLCHNIVWFVVGEGKKSRAYSLGSMFRVTETGEADEEGFKYFAKGNGHVFDPHIPLNELEWFEGYAKRFQFGVQLIKDEAHIASLQALATDDGAQLP